MRFKVDGVYSCGGLNVALCGRMLEGTIATGDSVTLIGRDWKRMLSCVRIEKARRFVDKARSGQEVALIVRGAKSRELLGALEVESA